MNVITKETKTGVVQWRQVDILQFIQHIAVNSRAKFSKLDPDSEEIHNRFTHDDSVVIKIENDEFLAVESQAACSEVFEPNFWIGERLS